MIVDWIPNLLVGWGVQWLGVLSPGPGVALILAMATTRGRHAAVTACLGIATGAVLLAMAGVFGLAALLADIAWAMTAVKLAGAAFLLWLAWNSFKRMATPGTMPQQASGSVGNKGTIVTGLTMQLTNPKAIIYWIAAAAVAGLETAPFPILALFVAGAFVNSFVGHGLWAVALSSRPFLSLYSRARRGVEGVLGIFFVFTAYKLATSRV